ncbi:MAG: alpha/beta fold hydrolase [Actinomycetes bacterium]
MSIELVRTTLGVAGPRLTLLHGLFGQGKNWTTVAKELSSDFQVTLVDLPDHGRSPWTTAVSYPDMAAAVATLLAEQEPGTVVGHSMGGKVAMVLALFHPELVARLCVVDIAPVSYAGLSSFATYVTGMRRLDLKHLGNRAEADAALAPAVPDGAVRSFLLQNLRREGPAGWRWQMNLDLLGDHLDELADWPRVDAAPYEGPVLWVAGSRSDYIRPDHGAVMRALFPRAQLVTVKGAGHWVHAEQPKVFVSALRRFGAASA